MNQFIFSLLFFCSFSLFSQEVLTNKTVIDFKELGFDDQVLIAKINTTPGEYKTDIEALMDLKENGISPAVIAAIINKEPEDIESGIFYRNESDTLIMIEPVQFAGTKTNYLTSALTYGLASNNVKSYVHNLTSGYNIPGELQVFEFKFAATEKENLGENNWRFSQASNPKDFILLKLTPIQNQNSRELKTGKIGGLSGYQTGIDPKNAIPFIIQDQEEKGAFRVRSKIPLAPGEYAFFFQGSTPLNSGFNNQSLFTFTIVK